MATVATNRAELRALPFPTGPASLRRTKPTDRKRRSRPRVVAKQQLTHAIAPACAKGRRTTTYSASVPSVTSSSPAKGWKRGANGRELAKGRAATPPARASPSIMPTTHAKFPTNVSIPSGSLDRHDFQPVAARRTGPSLLCDEPPVAQVEALTHLRHQRFGPLLVVAGL